MLRWISIFGGLLIMMGSHTRSEALFYYFRLGDQVPESHLLRLIDKHISLEFVRQRLQDSYSETGRPSIDPELLLRILLIGYLYGITNERKLVEELRMHLVWRCLVSTIISTGGRCSHRKNEPGRTSIRTHIYMHKWFLFLFPSVFTFGLCAEERRASAGPHNGDRLHRSGAQRGGKEIYGFWSSSILST